MLASLRFHAVGVESEAKGLTALAQAAQREPIDLVLLDWQMPEMDGVETARRIRELGLSREPDIIMISAYDLSELVDEIQRIGIGKRLTKPVTESQLFDAVMDVVGTDKDSSINVTIHHEAVAATEQGQAIQGAYILLVEDNEINQQVATEMLEQAGVTVDIAGNGVQAIAAIETNWYDAVLMDIQMPIMDGYEATRKIRRDSRFATLPIIAMTANAMSGDREKSIEAGMNDYVTKPINPNQVFSALAKWVTAMPLERGHNERPVRQVERPSAVPQADRPWPELPGVSIEDGLMRVGNNRNLYKKLLSQFRASNEETVTTIRATLAAGDLPTAARLAHTVKGVAANLGADELAAVGAELERALKQGKTDGVEELITRFATELDIVTDGIRVFEATLAESEVDAGQWERLKQHVDFFDMDSAFEVLKEIAKQLTISLGEV